MPDQLIGRGPGSTLGTWHIVRRPTSNEGCGEEDWDTWLLSLCSLVWEITETKMGEPTCLHCRDSMEAGSLRHSNHHLIVMEPPMPDPNKLQALRDAKFRVLPTCVSCRYWHGKRGSGGERWGACPLIPYQHAKHTDERMASTPDTGWCLKYEADREYLGNRLAAHMEFFDEEGISV